MSSNLGQAIGEMQLRIWQLEDEVERLRGGRTVPPEAKRAALEIPAFGRPAEARPKPMDVREAPAGRRGINRGVGKRIRAALPLAPPGLTVAEIAARVGDASNNCVSAYLFQFAEVEHTGQRGSYRYYRRIG